MTRDYVETGDWIEGVYVRGQKKISALTNEELLFEYGMEEESSSRRISTDGYSPIEELKEEILRRMKRNG